MQKAHTETTSGPLTYEHLIISLTSSEQVYNIYSVSQKIHPLRYCGNYSKTVGNFLTKFYVRSYLH